MVEIEIVYEGDLHTVCLHKQSGSEFRTDAPKDNQGKGELFSPTDLVATSMGSCMMTIMGIAARNRGIAIEGAKVTARKHMVADPLRRIGKIELDFQMPANLSKDERKLLENAADTCPVRRSLHPNVIVEMRFDYTL